MSLIAKFRAPAKPDALCGAMMHGRTETVKNLLKKKGRIDLEGTYGGLTPLAWAANGYSSRRGSPDMVRLLLEYGAEINAAASDGGTTALDRAASSNATEIINILLDAGADINLKNGAANTPLMTALLCGAKDAAELLLARGCDIGGVSEHSNCPGFTPLMLAASNNLTRCAEMLLDRGASLAPADGPGAAALKRACFFGETKSMLQARKLLPPDPPPAPVAAEVKPRPPGRFNL